MLASHPGLFVPEFVVCSTNVGEGLLKLIKCAQHTTVWSESSWAFPGSYNADNSQSECSCNGGQAQEIHQDNAKALLESFFEKRKGPPPPPAPPPPPSAMTKLKRPTPFFSICMCTNSLERVNFNYHFFPRIGVYELIGVTNC